MARPDPLPDAHDAAVRLVRGAPGLRAVRDAVGAVSGAGVTDEERVEMIRALEELKAAAAAAQARIEVAFDASQRSAQAAAGVRAAQQGRGVASQIGAARRESPHRGSRALGFARALVREMPHTLGLLSRGVLSEWRATVLVQETACLSVEDRAAVDEILCADPARIEGLGTRQLKAEAMRLAYRLDPASVVRRRARAEAERRVSIRPVPDAMTQVSGLVPMVQGVACHAALTRAADALIAAGDPRGRGQIMADLFVQRLTGQASADGVPVSVALVMSDRSLLGTDDEPARVPGQGPLPAWLARRVVAAAADVDGAWLRRLYADPRTGELVAMDSRARRFPEGLGRFVDVRDDGVCRTPWCDAPIRHRDHVVAFEAGGPTSAVNGQGLCQQCNHAKQGPGWHARPRPGPRQSPRHSVETLTPTGHAYRSTAPPLPGRRAVPRRSRVEIAFAELVRAS